MVGGMGTSVLNSLGVPTLIQFLPVGVTFAVSLWIAIGLFINRLSAGRAALLLPGCLAGFAVTPIVTLQLMPPGAFGPQPWTWPLLRPYLIGPATGALVVVLTVRAASGRVPLRVLFLVWLFISASGSVAFFAVDELGMRTRRFNESSLAFCCGTAFVAVVLSLIGWQLAEADCEHRPAAARGDISRPPHARP